MPVPVLPILLASLLDPDRDTVRLVCPPVGKLGQNLARELDQGLGQTFAACGFRGCHEPANGVPSALADVKAEDCTTVVSIIAGPLAAPSPASSAASLRLPLAALEKRGCAETEHVRALLASPARRILLVTPQSLLFSRRLFERDLRKDLLADNLVEASISLPAGLIPFKVTSCSLLVLDKIRREQHDYGVHFLDAGALDTGRLASLWDDGNLEGLRTLVRSSLSLDQAGCVTEDVRTLLKEESSLLATAHCLSEEARQVREYLKTRPTAPLGALVN